MAPAAAAVGDLPEVCLAQVIALTSPRDAARCAAVSPAFRAAADSDDVWRTFLPTTLDLDLELAVDDDDTKKKKKKKDAYLGLCDAGALVVDAAGGDGGEVMVWLEKATGARCYALSARRLSLPWDDGEFTWRWTTPTATTTAAAAAAALSSTTTPTPSSSRFPDVAELVADCACLDVYGRIPASALTPGTRYAAYLVYGAAAAAVRGLSFPDQETAVAVGGRVVARHAVCLCPDDDAEAAAARKSRAVAGGAGSAAAADVQASPSPPVRKPSLRADGWWEMEMGQVMTGGGAGDEEQEEVVASFEVLGWGPKRGLIIEAIEFRPLR